MFTKASKEIHDMTLHKIVRGDTIINEEGVLHFYKDGSDKMVYVTESEYEGERDKLPDLCFAIKYPIKNMQEKKFPDLSPLMAMLQEKTELVIHSGIRDSLTNDEIIGARYFGRPPPS